MSFRKMFSRQDSISHDTQELMKKVTEQIGKIPTDQSEEKTETVFTRIKLAEAESKYKVKYEGFDLYSIAHEEPSLAEIWKVEEVLDPATGKKEKWLVAYTTDDDEIVGQLTSQLSQPMTKEAKQNPILRTAAEPKKNVAPIAPGVTTKNLTLDQSGQGGKATVTVEFNDPQRGEEFFKQVEDFTGEVSGEPAPAQPKEEEKPVEEKPAEEMPEEKAPVAPQGKGVPPAPAVPPAPPLASTIKTLTHYGAQIAMITVEQAEGYAPKFSYVNEQGELVYLPWDKSLRVGQSFVRPDNGDMIRVGGYTVKEISSDDEDVINKIADDVSDRVPPMGWTEDESKNPNDALPQNPALNKSAPTTADTSTQPLYDSTKANETPDGGGTKQRFNMSVNPNDNSVTVKFEKPPALDELEEAVEGQQPQLSPGVQPQQGTPQQQQPLANQPKENFGEEAESPMQF